MLGTDDMLIPVLEKPCTIYHCLRYQNNLEPSSTFHHCLRYQNNLELSSTDVLAAR